MDPYHKELGRNVPKNSHEGNKGLGMNSPEPWQCDAFHFSLTWLKGARGPCHSRSTLSKGLTSGQLPEQNISESSFFSACTRVPVQLPGQPCSLNLFPSLIHSSNIYTFLLMLSPGDATVIVRTSDDQNIYKIMLPLSDRKLYWTVYSDQATDENHCMSANMRNGFAVKIGHIEERPRFCWNHLCSDRRRIGLPPRVASSNSWLLVLVKLLSLFEPQFHPV